MDFKDKLNEYIARLECNAKDLAEISGFSAATLSRYRSGERVPNRDHLASLTNGIIKLAEQKGISGFSAESVKNELLPLCTDIQDFDFEKLEKQFQCITDGAVGQCFGVVPQHQLRCFSHFPYPKRSAPACRSAKICNGYFQIYCPPLCE